MVSKLVRAGSDPSLYEESSPSRTASPLAKTPLREVNNMAKNWVEQLKEKKRLYQTSYGCSKLQK